MDLGSWWNKFIPQSLGGPSDNLWNIVADTLLLKTGSPMFSWWASWFYENLALLVSESQPRRIVEIGVGQGRGAITMIKAARESGVKDIEYHGFDLFSSVSFHEIEARISGLGAKIYLYKGDSRNTMPKARFSSVDFAYIDGSNLYEVVKSDWKNVQSRLHSLSIVVFDDYKCYKGVTKVVNEIQPEYQVEILGPPMPSWASSIPFVVLRRKHAVVRRSF